MVTGETINVSGNPLDFSFLKLTSIDGKFHKIHILIVLKKEEPRSGKRKPIEESDDEEESKKVRIIILITK